ncbi:MAG: hypothetical protein KAT35_03355, partial [Candidatus Aenigmarchaeota archaeon]|nr:hypothetical protein [Candidatus Aenigmarchaeota archaeon]
MKKHSCPVRMRRIPSILPVFVMLISSLWATQAQANPLTVHPDNPRYFADSSGNAVYLTGSHT